MPFSCPWLFSLTDVLGVDSVSLRLLPPHQQFSPGVPTRFSLTLTLTNYADLPIQASPLLWLQVLLKHTGRYRRLSVSWLIRGVPVRSEPRFKLWISITF